MITIRISSTKQGEGKSTIALALKKLIESNTIDCNPNFAANVEFTDEADGKRPAKATTRVYIIEEVSL